MANNKPVHTHRDGDLSVSIFGHEHNGEMFYNATPQRSYLDKADTSEGEEGTWKYVHSFGRRDLPVVASLMTLAHQTILRIEQAARDNKAKR